MKKRLLHFVTILLVLFSNLAMVHRVNAQTFVHPGAPLSKSDLDILKAHIKAGDYPWKQAYDIMAADGQAQLTYKMGGPFATVTRSPDLNLWPWRNDMTAAFKLSLMWSFTGNEAYAIKARDILMAWATTETSFGGQLGNLDLGDYAYAYGGAASILRGSWSGWTAANTTAVQNLFNNVYWPSTGCNGYALGPSNKGDLSLSAGAVIATFSDDPAKVAHIVYLARYIGATGLKNTLPNGQNGESARDQGHAHGTWNNLAFTAEVLYKQGIDIYSDLEDRIMANAEYFSRKNLGLPIGYMPFGTTDWYYLTDQTLPWDQGRFGPTLAHGAYIVRKKQSSAYLTDLLNNTPRRLDPIITWFYKSEDNSTATAPPQAEIVPSPQKVGTGGLTDLDIGGASPAGSSSYGNNTWTVRGSGAEIKTHSTDAFHFVYTPVTGNCSIIAKVQTAGGGAMDARAGVMIRSDLTSTSAQRAWIAIKSGKRAESFMHGWTEMRGGSNWENPQRPIPQDSYWVKIERTGDMIVTYYSPDGASWAAECQGRFEGFTGTAYIGLMVCSEANGVLNTAVFNNVSVTGGQGGVVTLPEAPALVAAYPGDNQMRVRWLSSFGADSYTLKRSSSANGPYTTIASNLSGNIFMDTNAANGQTYYYKVCAVNAAGTSPDSPSDAGTPEAPPVPQVLGSNGFNGVYRIIATNSNKAVEVKNGSTADGALVGQKTYAYLSNQHWIITPISGTDYKITNLLSGKAMDVVGNAKTNGAGIEQRTYSATDSGQVWTIKDRLNGTFNIVGKQSQKALEVPGSSTAEGVSMDLYLWNDNTNQIFRIEPVQASEISSAYIQKLAAAIKLRDTTQTSATNVPGKFPVTANAQLNDSITYVQSLYNAQSTVMQVSGYITVLDNAMKRYLASKYYQMNALPDGYYYIKTLTSDSLFTRNETNTPLFDVVNSDPSLQIWNITKQSNGRYKITCLSTPPASFSNYINESAVFGRNVSPFSLVWNSMNFYFDGTGYAIQRAQTAGNGYWYPSGRNIFTIGGSDNDPTPYTFPFRFQPVTTIPVNLRAAGGDGKNILNWDPIPNVTYKVKRSTTSGGPYTTIASISTTTYTDSVGVSNGSTYYYQVTSPDSLAASPVVIASPNAGQVTYLKFDETSAPRAFDSWGAKDGTLAASATRSTGKYGNSLKLDGSANGYATLPTGIVSTLNDFTISTWVKMDGLANWMRVFDFGTGGTQYMFLTVQAGTATANGVTSSIIRYAIKNGGGEQSVSFNYNLQLNAWTHFAVTQSGNTTSLYINGVLVSSNTGITIKPSQLTAAGTTTGTTLNYLGKSQFSDPMFKGAIDEFKIYNRALSTSEIASAFSSQSITMNTIAPKLMGDNDFDPAATASSGLPVTYTSSDTTIAKIVNGKVHILTVGTCTITASQAGNDVYWPALSQSQVLSVAITNNTQPVAVMGRPFTYTITNRPLSNFTATGLPGGLSVDANRGIISGTPTEYGTFPVVIGAVNDTIPGTQTITLTVQNIVISNVTVAAGDAKNIVQWSPIQGFTFNVKRSTTSGGPYTTIANVNGTRFTDTGVSNGSAYYYVVAPIDSIGELSPSAEVVALPNSGQFTYLKFDEASGTRAIDSWGATDGTLAATATRNTGKYGTSLKLDGTATSYATLPTGIVSTLSDFTVSTWVKMDAISTWMRVFDLGNGSTQYMFLTVQAGTTTVNGVSNSIVRYGIKNGSPAEQNISANFVFPLSTWVHLAVTQSGTTTNLYINGTLAATKTGMTIKPSQLTPTGTTTGTSLNYLGKSQFNDPMFKGSIDEFKIYNRALSAAEIAGSMKSSQTITFSAFADKALGVADFDPAATASSGLTVTYTSSNTSVATIVNGMIHVLGAGTSTITAAQAGNTDYTAAPSITRILTVKNLQTINFPAIAQKVISDADFDAGATASSGLAISYTSSDGSVATIVNGKVHILGAGTATITATQAGNAGYLAAAPVSQNLTVKNPQTITFAALPVKGAGSADFDAGATTSSGLPVSYTSSDTTVATIVNGKIHLVGLGTTTITATQAGNVAWLPASSVSQTLLVTDQTPPVVKTTDVTLSLDASGNAVLTAARVDNGSSDNIGISSLTIDKTSFSCANIGSNTVTLTATDAAGNISSATATVTVKDTIAPRVITQNLIANLDANGNANVNPSQINNGSTDNCSIASYGLDKTSFDCTNIGANTVTLTVTDGSGNRSTATAVVLVQDKIAPVVPVLADITAECSATATAPTTADNCAGTVTGTTTDALTYTTQGTHVIHWSFSDGNGNVSTATQNVIIKDVTAPVVPVLADVTGECSATATVPSTTDNCAGTVDGTTTDPLTYNTQGIHVIHWSFSDGNGNISTATQNVIIKDVTAPAVPILADVTGECSATATAPSTTDNCAGTVTGTTSDTLSYTTQGTHVIHWSFSDGNGNVSTATQNVIVKDDIAPIVIAQNIIVQLDASGKASITPSQINNGSSDNCSIATYALNKSTFDCSNVGANNVTLTVTDASGNSSTATAIVTVQDNTAPTVVTQNITVNLDASGKATITEAQINNGSTDNCSIATYALDKKTFDCSNVGANTVTLTVTDASGNVSTGTAIVTVLDNTAPIVLTKNITVYLSGGKATITPGQVDNGSNDACGIKSMSLSRTSFDCSSQGANTVTLTVTDSHNNTAIGTAVVTVIGKTPAPSITVSRSDNTNTGLDANTVALGYGAQSLILTATNSNSASGASTYAWSPATGLSNANVANPVFTPTQAGIYTFHVLVTSEYGCQASTTVTINVTDVRCGNNGDKVSVCHKTGSSNNPYTQLCISPNAVPAQLANGGTLGACQYIQSTGTLSLASDVAAPSADTVNKVVDPQIMLKAYPNPFAQQTTVNFTVPVSDQKVSLDVYNIYGLLISHLYNGKAEAGQDYRFAFDGIRLLPGVYIVRLTTSKAVKNFKLILAK